MTIHHATIKRAEKHGVIMTEIDREDGIVAQAHWAEGNKRIQHADAREALNAVILMKAFAADWPNLELTMEGEEFIVNARAEEIEVYHGATVPEIGDILDATHELDVDPEIGFDEDAERRVIVATKYRTEYAARGNPNHCGDWIADMLDGQFEADGKFDAKAFTDFLILNGVDMTGKWALLPSSGQRGWQGRYRMGGRQKLAKVLARTGVLKINNTEVKVPGDYIEELQAKHPAPKTKKDA